MNAFLKEMELKGIIKTNELQKGVLSITSINKESEEFKFYKKPQWYKEKETGAVATITEESLNDLTKAMSCEIIEMFKVDGNNDELFRPRYK